MEGADKGDGDVDNVGNDENRLEEIEAGPKNYKANVNVERRPKTNSNMGGVDNLNFLEILQL